MKNVLLFYSGLSLLAASCGETKDNNGTDTAQSTALGESSPKESEYITAAPPKLFFWDYNESRGIEEAFVVSRDSALMLMNELPEADGNFLGLELSDGSIVQFMYDGKSGWFLDIPDPVSQESFNADMTRDKCVEIVGDVYDGKTAEQVRKSVE